MTTQIILSAKLPGGSNLRDIADTQVSYTCHGIAPLTAAKQIAEAGISWLNELIANGKLRLTSHSRADAVYTYGHGIVVAYASGRTVAVND